MFEDAEVIRPDIEGMIDSNEVGGSRSFCKVEVAVWGWWEVGE